MGHRGGSLTIGEGADSGRYCQHHHQLLWRPACHRPPADSWLRLVPAAGSKGAWSSHDRPCSSQPAPAQAAVLCPKLKIASPVRDELRYAHLRKYSWYCSSDATGASTSVSGGSVAAQHRAAAGGQMCKRA